MEKTIEEQAEFLLTQIDEVVNHHNSNASVKTRMFIDFDENNVEVVKEISKIKQSNLHPPDAYFNYFRTLLSFDNITVCINSIKFKIETNYIYANRL